jgi:protein-S-isoprenylcysteine O-methyltransferase Ste14
MPTAEQILRESWLRWAEYLPDIQRPWRAARIAGLVALTCGLLLAGGYLVDQAVPYGGVAVHAGFWLWAGAWMRGGFWPRREEYRRRFGMLAYRQLCVRFLLPAVLGGLPALFFPVLVGGEPLLPPWLAYAAAGYLLITSLLLAARGPELFLRWDLRAFVYSVFPKEGQVLFSGVFTWLRHPVYSAFVRWSFALALVRNNAGALACAGLTAVGLWLWSRVEERELVERDASYESYRRRVPALAVIWPVPLVRFWRFLATGAAGPA